MISLEKEYYGTSTLAGKPSFKFNQQTLSTQEEELFRMVVNNNDSSIVAKEGESMPTDCYEKERLRQASKGFNVGHWLTLGGAAIFLANPLLLLSGNISAATATTVGGLASVAIVHGSNLCKDANDRMNEAAKVDKEEIE